MRRMGLMKFSLALLIALLLPVAYGQEQRGVRVLGEVTAKSDNGLMVKPATGEPVSVPIDSKTTFRRIAPGETDLSKASTISLAGVHEGDRVRALLTPAGPAASIIVISKADISKKHEADKAEWQRRGATGSVNSVNAERNEIEITERAGGAKKTTIVEIGLNTQFKRYAPESIRFADAKISSAAEVKSGDQVRVLGDRSADGSRVKAEVIVSGSFRNIAGTVISADAAAGEIRLTNLDTKKPMVIKVNRDTTLRQLPERMAMMLARVRDAGATPPPAPPAGNQPGGPTRGGDLSQMIDRFPPFTLTDLKPGEPVIVASTAGDPNRATAITILTGVEPLLAAAPQSTNRAVNGAWNFDINIIP